MSQWDDKINYLVNMGFPEDEATMAIRRCGLGATFFVLVDSICASQAAGDDPSKNLSDHETKDENSFDSLAGRRKTDLMEDGKKKRKLHGNQPMLDYCSDEDSYGGSGIQLPNPMVGFNLPSDPFRSVNRKIPTHAMGPPFFYFKNVARTPKGA